jgi:hypothetical protein
MERSINRRFTIEKTSFPLDGIYNYNVSVWISIDGGPYVYAGLGRYTRTKKDALQYIRNYKEGTV